MSPQEEVESIVHRSDIQEFTADGRAPLPQLYRAYQTLAGEHGWHMEVVFRYPARLRSGETLELPVLSFRTPQPGPALWIISGIHGEEPAGPNAIARNLVALAQCAQQGIPIVLLPLCNPDGYRRDWRYPNEPRNQKRGLSVGDANHLLPDLQDPTKPRAAQPTSAIAAALIAHALALAASYPPRLVNDHHEDEDVRHPYIYSQGAAGAQDPVAQAIAALLRSAGMPLQMTGTTRFQEPIVQGVVGLVHDDSIDELLTAKTVVVNGQPVPGPGSITTVIIETPTLGVSLEQRTAAHSRILQALPQLWSLVPQAQ